MPFACVACTCDDHFQALSMAVIVSFPDPTMHANKGSGDIGTDSVLEHVRSCDGAQDQENASMSLDPFPLARWDVGTRLWQ